MPASTLRSGSALWRAVFWLTLLAAMIVALLPKDQAIAATGLGDKVEHMLAFAVLAVLAHLAFPAVSRLRLVVLLSLFGAGIEVFQAIPVLHRTSDVRDWVADTLAAGLVLGGITLAGRPER